MTDLIIFGVYVGGFSVYHSLLDNGRRSQWRVLWMALIWPGQLGAGLAWIAYHWRLPDGR